MSININHHTNDIPTDTGAPPTTSVLTNVPLSLSSVVPKNAKMCKGRISGYSF